MGNSSSIRISKDEAEQIASKTGFTTHQVQKIYDRLVVRLLSLIRFILSAHLTDNK